MTQPQTVLLIEDEPNLVAGLRDALEHHGYNVLVAQDGNEGIELALSGQADLILLDIMLPGKSGIEVCGEIRQRGLNTPVIMLTAKSQEEDKILGLDTGADDYVTKPFSMRELVSRIRANLRRGTLPASAGAHPPGLISAGPVTLDSERHEVRVAGELVPFRPKEFELLEALMLRQGRLATRQTLLDEVWGAPFYGDPKTLDVHVRRIREKIEPEPHSPRWIVTVRGLGYKFSDDESEKSPAGPP